MRKVDLAQAISILANLGVIAGIVFLGVEVRQNNQFLESEARSNRASHLEETYRLMASNGELASIMLKGRTGEELTELEAYRARQFWLSTLFNLEWAFREMSPEELDSSIRRFRTFFSSSAVLQETWQESRSGFGDEFISWVDANLVDD